MNSNFDTYIPSPIETISETGTNMASNIVQEVEHDWLKIGLIIFVLALLGINIFAYLSEITNFLARTFGPLFGKVANQSINMATEATQNTLQTSSEGAQKLISSVSHGAKSGLGELEEAIDGKVIKNNIDGRQIHISPEKKVQNVIDQDAEEIETALTGKIKGQPIGFCYIGTDRGYRSCVKVGEEDKCMSGKIFPTKEVCISPSLRP